MNFESEKFFDIYKVGEKLGHGHFAEVKHCIDKNSDTEYAAKFIRVRQVLDSKSIGMSLEEIEREAHILKMLNHQNIIKLFFCYHLGKTIALVLELVSGGELFDHISDSEKLSEEEASEFIEQILYGVQHMHDRKVVHLDLKPENVMIEDLEERKIKLIDFGLAREIKKQNTIIEMQGTAEFLAPEVINYDAISYATDMWAIGVITYIMLTGVSPFSGDDQSSTFQNIVNCKLDFEEDVCSDMSEMAKSFINSLLVYDPKKRATASSCLKHPWIKPIEQATVFRRRSSIISRDKLQSLKQFVVYPSPPSSGSITPKLLRKNQQKSDLVEDIENLLNDDEDELILLNSVTKIRTSTLEPIHKIGVIDTNNINNLTDINHDPSIISEDMSRNNFDIVEVINDSEIKEFHNVMPNNVKETSFTNLKIVDKTHCNNDSKNISCKPSLEIENSAEQSLSDVNVQTTSSCLNDNTKSTEVNCCQESSAIESLKLVENEKNKNIDGNSTGFFLSSESLSNSQNGENSQLNSPEIITNEHSLKQKFNNTIANSVKKLNSKIESITSLFDSKPKSNLSFNLGKRRGSLKNSLNINTGLFLSSSERNKQLFSALTTERSTSYDETVKFSSKPVSASVATSPTVLKKSVFISRYMAHIESKKN